MAIVSIQMILFVLVTLSKYDEYNVSKWECLLFVEKFNGL